MKRRKSKESFLLKYLPFFIISIFLAYPLCNELIFSLFPPYSYREYEEDVDLSSSRYTYVKNKWDSFYLAWKARWNLDQRYAEQSNLDLGEYVKKATSYQSIYSYVLRMNHDKVKDICEAFTWFAKENRLSDRELIWLVISYVQTIPYEVPPENLSLRAPKAVLLKNSGDCDSKAMLAVAILRRFGFDCTILLSKHYQHAMLGVNTVCDGKYLDDKGRPYYFVEITGKGHPIGSLPVGVGDLSHWQVIRI